MIEVFVEKHIFETIMTLRYLRPGFVRENADYVIEEAIDYSNLESKR